MFFVALGALLPLFYRCQTPLERIAIGVYAVCALAMFGISSLYHRVTWSPERRALWKKFDHSGIYLMIAGSFTPIVLLGLRGDTGHRLLLIVWCICLVGIIKSLVVSKLPKAVSAILYMLMGYLILPYLSELFKTMGPTQTWLIISGGLVYSTGAFFYALKRPVLNPKIFSYHEIFHVFVNIGAALHFMAINALIP